MQRILFYLSVVLIFVFCSTQQETKTFKAMAWNILHGGNDIENGAQNVIQIIKGIHNGLIVPWYSTKVLEDLGLIDTDRTLHPEPIAHPGITWDTKGEKDEHRLDYIYYKGARLKAVASKSYKAFLNEPFSINGKTFNYPSDHGFVVTTFSF